MGRFFGPTPNVISSDGFFRGTSKPPGWTSRGHIAGNDVQQIAYGNGVFIAAANSNLYRSTNDGVSWTLVDTNTRGYGQITYDASANVWGAAVNSISGGPAVADVVRSTNNGVTWGAPIVTGATAPINGLAASNLGIWVATSGNGSGTSQLFRALSVDSGASWETPALTTLGTMFRCIWDGTRFVASCRDGATGNNASIATSADGFNWVITQISALNNYIFGLCFDSVSGRYVVVTNDATTARIATTPAGLAAAPDTSTGLSDGAQAAAIGNGLIWVFGAFNGDVSKSTDNGNTFALSQLNFSPSTDSALCADYDPVHKIFVAGGVGGNIATFP